MYTTKNFKSKKELKAAVEAFKLDSAHNAPVRLFAPGLGQPKENGIEFIEGPHYPEPHKWYAQVQVENGIVVKVK